MSVTQDNQRHAFIQRVRTRIHYLLSSTWFFVASLCYLAVQAIWLIFSAIYPLPFDEYYHFGIITYYADQWGPFITNQTAEASLFGDITRYPSYLFHYLMSFPYRLIATVFTTEEGQIIILRLLSLALFIGGVVLFRHLFLRAGLPRWLTHLAVVLFVTTPVVPFLAAHITYDSLIMVLTPLYLLLGYQILSDKTIRFRTITLLLSVGLLACLVKETFLPVLIAVLAVTCTTILYRWKGRMSELIRKIAQSLRAERFITKVLLIGVLILSVGLFSERFIQNQLFYGGYNAPCEAVQPVEVCEQYGPWYRNSQNILQKTSDLPYGNPVSFTQHWVTKIMRGYFAIFSHTPTEVVSKNEPFGPIVLKPLLPLPIVFGYAGLAVFVICSGLQIKHLWRNQFYRYLIVIIAINLVAIWVFNYTLYLKLGAAQAIQARYTLPLLLGIFVIGLQAVSWSIRSYNLRLALASALIIPYLLYGGISGWLIRADETWYWQRPGIIEVNQRIGDGLETVIPN